MKLQIRILLVDDHPIIRQCIRLLLDRNAETTVVGETDNGESAISLVQQLKPDVVIMDIMMPVLNGIEATRQILKLLPKTKVIALSAHFQKSFVKNMFDAGACGYLLKDSLYSELVPALKKIWGNELYISQSVVKKYCNLP